MSPQEVINLLQHYRFSLQTEKELQTQIYLILKSNSTFPFSIEKEYKLSKKSTIDFYFPEGGIGMEIKIKGSSTTIYKQCVKYCECSELRSLILVTNKAMGLPEKINNKSCYLVNLGKAWL